MNYCAAEGKGAQFPRTKWKYDAHICLDDEQLKNAFVCCLKQVFSQNNIKTTSSDLVFAKGKEISQTILDTIEQARCSILLLCHKFPFSTKCLYQLDKIIDCMKRNRQLVLPVFYQIDPSEVRHLKGSYGEAMEEHLETFQNESITVHRWIVSLRDASDLAGWTYKTGCETKSIKEIVEEITKNILNSTRLCNDDCLAGLVSHLTEPCTLLDPGCCDDVDTLRKKGIGEIGAIQNMEHSSSRHLDRSSHQKESDHGETFLTPSIGAVYTREERGELVSPQKSVVHHNSLSNLQLCQGIGLINGAEFNVEATSQQKQTWSEITHPKLLDSRSDQVSISSGVEVAWISSQLDANYFDSAPNDVSSSSSCASFGAEASTPSAVQDVGSTGMKFAMKFLQISISRRFTELLTPEGFELMDSILNNVLRFCVDEQISEEMRLVVQQISNCFTRWVGEYQDADIKLKKTSANLSKLKDLENRLAGVINDTCKAASAEEDLRCKLLQKHDRKRELEEELMVVEGEISHLTLSLNENAERKQSLFQKVQKLRTEKNNLIPELPHIKSAPESAKLIQKYIEDEWFKLGERFNKIFMLEFGSV